jgi:hypothetical protein
MIARMADVSPDRVFVLPFPYPPWYALSTFWLAFLPVEVGVRLWFGLNLLMLFASIWLMTEGWTGYKRLAAFLPPFLFVPVLGTLLVGQYVFPVLLGAALWVYAVEKEKPVWVALASALLTFKPHLGALILLAGLFYLARRKDGFGQRALIYTMITGVLLFALGFLADPAWPVNYFHSLLAFRQVPGVPACTLCTSLPVLLERLVDGQVGFSPAPAFSLVILAAMSAWWGSTRRSILQYPIALLSLSVFTVLLVNPYLLNYDFVLLLLPFFILMKHRRTILEYLLLGSAYMLPLISLDFLGRQGNSLFLASTFILLLIFHRDTRQLDVSYGPAYNPATME